MGVETWGTRMDRRVVIRARVAARVASPAVAVVVALGLTGCGSSNGDSSSPAPSSVAATSSTAGGQNGSSSGGTTASATPASAHQATDPCALVSRQEAEQLAGTSLNNAVSQPEACTYTAPTSGPTAQVEVFAGETAKSYLAAERGIGHQLQPLPGIGDEAYVEDYAVFVNKHDVWVSIDLTRSNDPAENRGPLENLARTVASRL
ncbi:DUF3558 domain-containing protein [Frankia sp. AgB1.9]|nr:DUF3558 domain-containing protein [Frankia sp. AgW1.1]MBL7552263.1 DUF3558 domain-containing protein [Frankia sp. AgB1.9]MBL7623877.1 DUF3558 domain-containing protein [Frankia sp. AgB1.8]